MFSESRAPKVKESVHAPVPAGGLFHRQRSDTGGVFDVIRLLGSDP